MIADTRIERFPAEAPAISRFVVYDAPSRERVVEKDKSVLADVFELAR